MELNLRVRNYKVAIDLINDCRDIFNIQPDAMMYETLLAACLRDGFLSEKARAWKKRFHKYPKGIEVRTEHFEFAEFIKELQEYLGDSITNAVPVDGGELIKINRTTRKQSKRFYKYYTYERYTSPFEVIDKYDWVPEYMKRVNTYSILIVYLIYSKFFFFIRKKKPNLQRLKKKKHLCFLKLKKQHKKNKWLYAMIKLKKDCRNKKDDIIKINYFIESISTA